MSNTIIKKILEWIKAMVSKLAELIPRQRQAEREPTPHVDKALERRLAKRIQQGAVRPVDTRQGGPNMPRRQPCPSCHKRAKRKRKTMGGGYYECRKHGEFFVRAPRL